VIESVLEQKDELNIAAYELFSLRDADSSNPEMFHQFGIMTDAYLPKAAYRVFKDLLTLTPNPDTGDNCSQDKIGFQVRIQIESLSKRYGKSTSSVG
jgi:hypothetical protein